MTPPSHHTWIGYEQGRGVPFPVSFRIAPSNNGTPSAPSYHPLLGRPFRCFFTFRSPKPLEPVGPDSFCTPVVIEDANHKVWFSFLFSLFRETPEDLSYHIERLSHPVPILSLRMYPPAKLASPSFRKHKARTSPEMSITYAVTISPEIMRLLALDVGDPATSGLWFFSHFNQKFHTCSGVIYDTDKVQFHAPIGTSPLHRFAQSVFNPPSSLPVRPSGPPATVPEVANPDCGPVAFGYGLP